MIINYLINNLNKTPNKSAIICDNKTYTYLELSRDIKCTCQLFKSKGIKTGSHVLVSLDNSYEFVLSMFALADIGAVLVPINTTLSIDSIEKIIKSADVEYIIGTSNKFQKYANRIEMLIESEKWFLVGKSLLNSLNFSSFEEFDEDNYDLGRNDIDIEDNYILTMTSGSTGKPKPIIFSQKTKIDRALNSAKNIYSLNNDDIIIASSPMYHSLAQRLVLLPIIIGGTSVILKNFNPQIWLESIEKFKVTFTIVVSANLEVLLRKLEEKEFDLSSLKTIVSSSALLKDDIKSKCIRKFNADFHEIYGASEIGTATNLFPEDSTYKMNSVGRPLEYVDLKIVDENGKEVENGKNGEIICKSPTLFCGYYKNEKITQQNVKEGYFFTGDIGQLDSDGFLYFKGRKKDVINVGGSLVYPKDIEEVINTFEFIEECSVIGVDDIYFGEAIVVALVVRDNMEFNLNKIKQECRNKLADFQQPMGYEIVESLPKNAMGKVMKFKLKEMFLGYDASALIRKIMKI